jgi:DedD protein
MAQPVTDKEIGLRKRARRRLVGAIALVLVVAVVLPWVVDDDPPPRLKNVDIAIPAVESIDRKFPTTPPVGEPLAAPAGPGDAPVASPVPGPDSPGRNGAGDPSPAMVDSAEAAPATPATASAPTRGTDPAVGSPPHAISKPAPKPEPGIETKAVPKPDTRTASATPVGRGFVMQVGAFSSADKAKQLQQQLRAAGFPAYLEAVKTASGERTRVRAGPFATVEAAQKARTKLIGLKVAQGDLKVVPREN